MEDVALQDVKEQMMLRLDEIGESYEKVILYTSNKAEQTRGQKDTAAPMEHDCVCGSEMYDEEEWDDAGEVKEASAMPRLRDDGTLREGMQGREVRAEGKDAGKS